MKRSLFAVALAGMALVTLPFAARAQVSTVAKPVQFGIAAGASLPMSDLSNEANTGFNVTWTVGLHPQMIPLGIRIDVAYNRFGEKAPSLPPPGNLHFTSATGNLVYSIPSETVAPYLIGGAGIYNGASDLGIGFAPSNHFGWNIGGGIKMPLSGFDTFLEARYNQIQVTNVFQGSKISLKFIPITFGVMF